MFPQKPNEQPKRTGGKGNIFPEPLIIYLTPISFYLVH